MIGVSACVVNPQGCNAVAKAFLEVIVREELPKSSILNLSSDEQQGGRLLMSGVLQLSCKLTYATRVEKPDVVYANYL